MKIEKKHEKTNQKREGWGPLGPPGFPGHFSVFGERIFEVLPDKRLGPIWGIGRGVEYPYAANSNLTGSHQAVVTG